MLIQTTLLFITAFAQRPADVPICDYYTTALFKDNTEANQNKLLAALVNRVVVGNLSATANGKPVTGILAKQNFQGQAVDLAPFFTGAKATTNEGGVARAVNFLDDDKGSTALAEGKAAKNENSKQFFLLTHLYQVFGELIGCSKQGTTFKKYEGNPSMYETHKFMNLRKVDIDFFNDQVGQAAVSFGVTVEDATIVGNALDGLFNQKCSAPVKLVPSAADVGFQSMCPGDGCRDGDLTQCPPDFNAQSAPQTAPHGQGKPAAQVYNKGNKVFKCVPRQKPQGTTALPQAETPAPKAQYGYKAQPAPAQQPSYGGIGY